MRTKEMDQRKKKVLVLVADYPNNDGGVSLMYVHTRNIYYSHSGIDVTVLNFKAKEGYIYDGIRVISLKEYIQEKENYDILIVHAANIRNHYLFLKKYGDKFAHFIFFFHGHEVLKITKVYSQPYAYVHQNVIKKFLQDMYDTFKLTIWHYYYPKVKNKSRYVFVSNWMYKEFFANTKIKKSKLEGCCSITYNSVGKEFQEGFYDIYAKKEYDFVTIRANLDGSKYCADLVNRLARNTPEARFLLVGKGEFFKHFDKAPNVMWLDQRMNHEEIKKALNLSRYALMPTRTDAQGLMMCEMAAFGIPVITSDIPVCHEVFDGFDNAFFIDNNDSNLNLKKFMAREETLLKDKRFYIENTVDKEVEIIKSLGD